MKNDAGISIIILLRKNSGFLYRLLDTFFVNNTHHPFEFIIAYQGNDISPIEAVLKRYASRAFIRLINGNCQLSITHINRCIFQKTRFPYLLFLSDDKIFTNDQLSEAIDRLADPLVSSVYNPVCETLENGLTSQDTASQHEMSAATFLCCRKADFMFIGGFSMENPLVLENADELFALKTRLEAIHISRQENAVRSDYNAVGFNVLFVLPQPLDSNCGYHVERLAAGLHSQGLKCIVAVPQIDNPHGTKNNRSSGLTTPNVDSQAILPVYTYREIQSNGVNFSDGRGPDIIHAWTPREDVRRFVTTLISRNPCPVVVHLEDNEEYLTETAVGRPYADIEKLSEKEIDNVVPNNRYHPLHGRKWLEQVQGLTMIIDTLQKFNFGCISSMTMLPPVDERLFYPRPINWELRKQLCIPDDHIVIVYTGNVHAGNREEVLSLYRAVERLNQTGYPTTLIRTGVNAKPLTDGDDSWVKSFEKPLGWVDRETLPEIMAAADLFVQPGEPGAFNDYRVPCKLPEYFAIGRPVILPRSNLGLRTMPGVNMHVPDCSDAEGIVKAVLAVVKKNRPGIETGTELCGKNQPNNRYPPDSECERLERFYRMIVQQSRFSTVCSGDSNKKFGRIAFIDHFYHRKTRSSWFFLRHLARFFDIDVFWDYSYRGDKPPDGEYIRRQGYDFVVVWQCVHTFETLKALSGERLIGIPMYDNSGAKPSDMFLPNMEYLSFSSQMHETLLKYGRNSRYIQYFPDPEKFPDFRRNFSTLRGFFWQRTPAVTWDTIRQLIGDAPLECLHVHIALDADHLKVPAFPKAWRGMLITLSTWFENQSAYYEMMTSANIYFVPRNTEGIGLSFLEAMAMGMCVVAPDCPTMNEYIKHQENGLLYDRNNPMPLDFSNAETLGRNARQSIEAGRQVWLDRIMGWCTELAGIDNRCESHTRRSALLTG